MSQYLDFDGLSLYDKNVKKRTSEDYYNKDEVDNLIAGVEMNILWKDAVATYNDIATTYPYPREGWTVNVLDTGLTYRYDGDNWAEIFASVIPKATSSNDGLMSKEMYSKVDSLGTASKKDFTTAVDNTAKLPTAKAVNTYVDDAISTLSEEIEAELSLKVGIEELGDAANRNHTDEITEATDNIRIKGEWFSSSSDTLFYLKGSGVDDGIDMSFPESMHDYTIHFNLKEYLSPIEVKLHMIGTKTDPDTGTVTNIDTYCDDGDVVSIGNVPDEYLDGSDSAALEVTIPDYVEYETSTLEILIWPVFHDNVDGTDIAMIDGTKYASEVIIHQEYDVLFQNHIVTAIYGLYSSSDLPTASAVSRIVKIATEAVKTVLEAKIDEVEAKVDDYQEASDEDIDALFGNDGSASDDDIEGLFSI